MNSFYGTIDYFLKIGDSFIFPLDKQSTTNNNIIFKIKEYFIENSDVSNVFLSINIDDWYSTSIQIFYNNNTVVHIVMSPSKIKRLNKIRGLSPQSCPPKAKIGLKYSHVPLSDFFLILLKIIQILLYFVIEFFQNLFFLLILSKKGGR